MNKIAIIFLLVFFILLILLKPYIKESFSNKTINKNKTIDKNIIIDKIYVINLDESSQRLKDITRSLKRENMEFERVSGVVGKKLDKKKLIAENIVENKKLKKGEIGCALSHIKIWNKAVKENQNILVLEDDVIIKKNFWENFNKIQSQIPADFDIVYLGGSNIYGTKISENIIRPKSNKKKDTTNSGTYAMLINKKSIHKLLKMSKPLTHAIDMQIKKDFDKFKVYYVYQPLITHNNNISSDRRLNSNQKPLTQWFKKTQSKINIV